MCSVYKLPPPYIGPLYVYAIKNAYKIIEAQGLYSEIYRGYTNMKCTIVHL